MFQRRSFVLIASTVFFAIAPIGAYAISTGPNPFLTGNSKDAGGATCNQAGCHTGSALNLSGGKVQITLPGTATYVPGQTQQISVTVSDTTARAWGFQLTARVLLSNVQAGDLKITDSSTFVQCSDFSNKSIVINGTIVETPCLAAFPLQFIQHSRSKSGAASATFTFSWTAPATDVGTVIFYAAGNGANGNGADSGDHIYTTSVQLTAAATAPNKPAVSLVAPNNSASSTITSGSWISIYGTNLAGTSYLLTDADRVSGAMPTTLKGTSASINGKPAFVYYVSPNQVNVQAPDDSATGPVAVTVSSAAGTSTAGTVTLSKFAPALFLFDTKHPVGVIPVASGGAFGTYDLLGPPNTLGFTSRAVKKGETILLYGTGFGPTTASVAAGQPFDGALPTTNAVTLSIGGIAVTPDFAGLRYAGEYQFNVKIPANAASGEQPLLMSVGGVQVQSGLVISIQ